MSQPIATVPDVETTAGSITDVIAFMTGQSPHAVNPNTPLHVIPVEGFVYKIAFVVQQCFGVQLSPSDLGPEVRTIGQLCERLGTIVHDALSARGPVQRDFASSAPRRVLIVGGANSPELHQAVARRGRRAAMFTYVDPQSVGLQVGNMGAIEQIESVDWSQPLGVVQRIVDLYTAGEIDAVVPVDEFGLVFCALATTRLGIPGPSLRAVRNTRDKVLMRRELEKAGLAQVRYAACRDLAEGQAFLEQVGGQIILKPVAGTGSEGVSRVTNSDELAEAFKVAAAAAGFSGFLCEEYIDGPEVSLEGYSVNGQYVAVALTDKLTDENFLETGHQQPTTHTETVFNAAADIAARALAALGVDNGVTHTEFRISATRGPVLIETHTRMGGDFIHVLTRLTTGVDLADLMIAFSLGERVEVLPQSQGRAAAVRFLIGKPGRVRAVTVPSLPNGNGIHTVSGPPLGRVVSGRSASRERLGHVIASGATPQLAGQTAETFLSQIEIDYFA